MAWAVLGWVEVGYNPFGFYFCLPDVDTLAQRLSGQVLGDVQVCAQRA